MTHQLEIVASICFALALLHTFSVSFFRKLGSKYRSGSAAENFFHLLGEIEVVFGIWSAIFLVYFLFSENAEQVISFLESRNYTEPGFVFVIMAVCSTQPILNIARNIIEKIGHILPLNKTIAFYMSCLIVGPTLGSLITEPAAMTVTALILLEVFYKNNISKNLKYATLGLLFVNISIGGTFTHFAAPPVIMVAQKWGWDLNYMFTHFGWKALIAMIISTSIVAFRFRNELKTLNITKDKDKSPSLPFWVYAIHVLFLILIVASAHHMVVFMGLFLFFLGLYQVTREFQKPLNLREPLLVGFFLGGLIILGGPQKWWLEPLLARMGDLTLFIGAAALTAITDNAALTFLGAQVPNLTEASEYALVAGAVVGGGLTVIANAPNPAGYGILNATFGDEGITAKGLFINALLPTLVAGLAFWFL